MHTFRYYMPARLSYAAWLNLTVPGIIFSLLMVVSRLRYVSIIPPHTSDPYCVLFCFFVACYGGLRTTEHAEEKSKQLRDSMQGLEVYFSSQPNDRFNFLIVVGKTEHRLGNGSRYRWRSRMCLNSFRRIQSILFQTWPACLPQPLVRGCSEYMFALLSRGQVTCLWPGPLAVF